MLLLNRVVEIGIVAIEVLACLLSDIVIIENNILKKDNGGFGTGHAAVHGVNGWMSVVFNFAFLDEICHCVKWLTGMQN